MRIRIAPVLALTLAAAAPAAAFDMQSMTGAEREAFRSEVRQYLLDNPDVLMEAIGVLEARQSQQAVAADVAAVAAYEKAIFDDGVSWVGGNPEGDITLVEFMDYRCTYCRKAFPEVEELLRADGNIRFVVKELPVLGPGSVLASRFALSVRAAYGEDAYETAHDALISLKSDFDEPALARLAEMLGHDYARIRDGMDAPEIDALLQQNYALASQLGISGTPTFVIPGGILRGYVPLDAMRQAIEQARAEAG